MFIVFLRPRYFLFCDGYFFIFHFISLPYVTTTVMLYQSTSQHSRVCIVHLALTLSNPGLPIRVFSSINL